jgi:hypothetical protein
MPSDTALIGTPPTTISPRSGSCCPTRRSIGRPPAPESRAVQPGADHDDDYDGDPLWIMLDGRLFFRGGLHLGGAPYGVFADEVAQYGVFPDEVAPYDDPL